MSLVAVMIALEDRIDTVPGLQASGVRPEAITPPAAVVGVPEVGDYQQAYQRGKIALSPTVTILTSTRLDRPGQLLLAEFMSLTGTKSVPAAIHKDPTLGGVVEAAQVMSSRPLGLQEVGLINYYGGVLQLRILTKG